MSKPSPEINPRSAELTSIQLERLYRTQILSNELPAGTRLPSNKELAQQWRISALAVQEALSNLAAAGLVERRQRRGTFVCDTSNKACIGVLVGPDLIKGSSPFFRNLVAVICDRINSLYLTPRVYDSLTYQKESQPSYSHGNLVADQRSYRFKGHILVGTGNIPQEILDLVGDSPSAVFMDAKRGNDISIDYKCFTSECVETLHSHQQRKIVYLRSIPRENADFPVAGLEETIARLKLPQPEVWNLCDSADYDLGRFEEAVDREIDRTFGDARGDELRKKLPDAYIVQDDIIPRPLVANLHKRDIRIPEDVRICALTSSGCPVYYGVPVYRYEIRIEEIASHLCDTLNARLKGEAKEKQTRLLGGTLTAP